MATKKSEAVPESLPKDLKHAFYPWDLKLPHYVENKMDQVTLLAIFGACTLFVFIAAWIVSGRRKEPFSVLRRLALCWFMLCAFIHTIFEGYFAVYHASLAGHTSIMGEMWKLYGRCDSRYLSSDTFMVCMETITAVVDGPLAFIAFFAFMKGSNYRYSIQMVLSLCQLYGDSLYFLTEIKDGFTHGPYGHPVYFGFYFLFLNGLWIVIPLALIIDSAQHMASCQVVSDFYVDEYNRKIAANHSDKKQM